MSDSNTPVRWLDRLVSACLGLLLAAMALYGAVWLVRAVWVQLTIGTAAVMVLAAAWFIMRRRTRW